MTVQVTVQGTLRADGILELDDKVSIPMGRVLVTLQPVPQPGPDDPFWPRMERIWADQKARGHVPRTKEEIDGEIQTMRREWEKHQLAIERLQEECWKGREQVQKEKPE